MIFYKGALAGSAVTKRISDVLNDEAIIESAEYIKPFKDKVVFLEDGWWKAAAQKINKEGLFLEFGVDQGSSIRCFSFEKPESEWYGFDTFFGFEENWKGGFAMKGWNNLEGKIPIIHDPETTLESNVHLIQGKYKDTLPQFLKEHKDPIAFLHLNCHTYNATKSVLDNIPKDRLQKGCIVLIGDYLGYIGWKVNQFKAWQEYKIKYKYLAFGEKQAIIEVI